MGVCARLARRRRAPSRRNAPEQHDVRLGAVDGVVHPAAALLHAQGAPLVLQGCGGVVGVLFVGGGDERAAADGTLGDERATPLSLSLSFPGEKPRPEPGASGKRGRSARAAAGLPPNGRLGRPGRALPGSANRREGGWRVEGGEKREREGGCCSVARRPSPPRRRTSSSRRFLGRWLAISGGRTTCLWYG